MCVAINYKLVSRYGPPMIIHAVSVLGLCVLEITGDGQYTMVIAYMHVLIVPFRTS